MSPGWKVTTGFPLCDTARHLPSLGPVQGPEPGSGKNRGEEVLPVQADLPLAEMLPVQTGFL